MKMTMLVPLSLLCVLAGCATRPTANRGPAACCATEVASVTPLPDKSIYQLDSHWTNDAGRSLRLDALQGRVQVVALFFTSCNYACPLLVHDMQRIEAALPEAMRHHIGWTLVTLDTERDTPSALHAYRTARQLPERWTLLRSTPDDTLELAALLGVKFKREATGQFAHSNLITLLDERGEIMHQLVGLNQDVSETVRIILTRVRHE